eukprot:4978965-Ditylum_brightwellii.AAC.1
MSPTLHDDELSELQHQELTGGVYTIKQHKILFDQYAHKPNVKPKTETALPTTLSYAKGSEPFKTPCKNNHPVASEPDFDDKFDEPDDETIQDWKERGGSASMADVLYKTILRVKYLMDALPVLRRDVKGQAVHVGEDLRNIRKQMLGLESSIGAQAHKIEDIDFPDSWTGIHHLANVKADTVDVWSKLTTLSEKLNTASMEFGQLAMIVKDHSAKFMGLQNWILSVWKRIEEIPDLKAQVQHLESTDAPPNPTLDQLLEGSRQVEDCDPDPTLRGDIKELRVQVKLLQGRSSGERIHLGMKNFDSFPELLIFTKTELPNHHFGLTVDADSFTEFFFTDTSKSIEAVMAT